MRTIPLTKNMNALVDDDDYEWLSQRKWCSSKGYAVRYDGQRRKMLPMHREILNAPDGMDVDHINGDRLDNRRANLRVCPHRQNIRNQKPRVGGTSRYKGVYWCSTYRKWRVQIMSDKKRIHVGAFDDEEQAARAYDVAALEHHGEFARLNFPQD